MKATILILIAALPLVGFSQKVIDVFPTLDGKTTYEDVVSVDSFANKTELYNRAMIWMAKNYVSANDVIQVSDKEEGRIIGKGTIRIDMSGLVERIVYVDHTISIYTKDGKYKYIITDLSATFVDHPGSKFPMLNKYPKGLVKGIYSKLATQTDLKVKELIRSLKSSMVKRVDDF